MKISSLSYKNVEKMHSICQINGNTLYLGSYRAATDIKKLEQQGVTAVLTTAAGLSLDYTKNNIKHKSYDAMDSPNYNMSKHFSDAFKFIEQQLQHGSVLVHCAAGISRSSTIVISYLMKKKGWEFKKTLKFVKVKRSIISPNVGFLKQLENYEKKISIQPIKKTQPLQPLNITAYEKQDKKVEEVPSKRQSDARLLSVQKQSKNLLSTNKNSYSVVKPSKISNSKIKQNFVNKRFI